jgi:bifunctional UDP-N-acetylglucosamine pyrophosphorylase/glucosamine-1-phosphate N-acetyltransferase
LAGDGPLIRASTLRAILDRHLGDGQSGHADATLATSRIADPTGYGRIIRDAEGRFSAIVEHKHCTPEQLAVREVNPSYYCFDAKALFEALPQLKRNQPSGEYYITDVFEHMLKAGQRVEVIPAVPPEDVLSINTPEQLAEVDAIFRARVGGQGRQGGSR